METKSLRLEGVPGKQESEYLMTVPIPGRLDLLSMIEKPPFHIFSKDDTTYSTGVLAFVPHSIKLRISRDYQEPFVGLYIRLTPKADEIIQIKEVKGCFIINTSASQNHPNYNYNEQRCNVAVPYFHSQSNYLNGSKSSMNDNETSTKSEPLAVPFSFFKSSVSKLKDLDNYDYYESRCNWPDVACRMDLSVKVEKITYSFFVDDPTSPHVSSGEPKNKVISTPYFLSDVYSDVSIQVGEELFPAHKIILAERSQYFARMFANSMRESNEGLVKLADEDESLFREFLRFIYQGTVENLEESTIKELYILSDKYDVPELTTFCQNLLLNQLTVENAMELYDLSQSIGPHKNLLANRSKELIMWNREKFASDLQSFKDFSNKYPELIFELLQI